MSKIKRFLSWIVDAIRAQISPRVKLPDHGEDPLREFNAQKPIPITEADVLRFKRYQTPLWPIETRAKRSNRDFARRYGYAEKLAALEIGKSYRFTAYGYEEAAGLRRFCLQFMLKRLGKGSAESKVVEVNSDNSRHSVYIRRIK